MQKRTKESQKRINSLILLIAFTAILLIVSTYAWFTTQKDVTISNIKGTIEVAEGLQLSFDGDTWGQEFNLEEIDLTHKTGDTNATQSLGSWANDVNFTPTELLPVSSDGAVSGSSNILTFYKGTLDKTSLKNIAALTETPENIASGAAKGNGYIAFDIFLKDTSKDSTKPVTLQLDANSYAWALKGTETITNQVNGVNVTRSYTGDWTSGIQNTIRVGFAFYDHTGAASADKYGITAEMADIGSWAGSALIDRVAIWEPNADRHADQAVKSNNKYTTKFKDAVITAPSSLTSPVTTLQTLALNSTAVGKTIANVYSLTGDETGCVTAVKTMQTTQRTQGAADGTNIDPRIKGMKTAFAAVSGEPSDGTTSVQDYSSYYTQNLRMATGDNSDLGFGSGEYSTQDIQLKPNAVTKCRVYVWLEGQDVDCINYASYGGGIQVEIGLCKDRTGLESGNYDRIKDDGGNLTTNPLSGS